MARFARCLQRYKLKLEKNKYVIARRATPDVAISCFDDIFRELFCRSSIR